MMIHILRYLPYLYVDIQLLGNMYVRVFTAISIKYYKEVHE